MENQLRNRDSERSSERFVRDQYTETDVPQLESNVGRTERNVSEASSAQSIHAANEGKNEYTREHNDVALKANQNDAINNSQISQIPSNSKLALIVTLVLVVTNAAFLYAQSQAGST